MIFTDEASFRQDSTLHATWSRVGHAAEVPVTGERKNVKILGGIELWRTRFHYREDTVFNASSYLAFLEQLARSYRRQGAILIQDNASYHKDADVWNWFRSNRHWLEVHHTAALFAGVQSHRTVVATHAQDWNSQPILYLPRRTRNHPDSRFRRDAMPPSTHPLVPASFLLTIMSL